MRLCASRSVHGCVLCQGLSEEALVALLAAVQEREDAARELFTTVAQQEGKEPAAKGKSGAAREAKTKQPLRRKAAPKGHDTTSSDEVGRLICNLNVSSTSTSYFQGM